MTYTDGRECTHGICTKRGGATIQGHAKQMGLHSNSAARRRGKWRCAIAILGSVPVRPDQRPSRPATIGCVTHLCYRQGLACDPGACARTDFGRITTVRMMMSQFSQWERLPRNGAQPSSAPPTTCSSNGFETLESKTSYLVQTPDEKLRPAFIRHTHNRFETLHDKMFHSCGSQHGF